MAPLQHLDEYLDHLAAEQSVVFTESDRSDLRALDLRALDLRALDLRALDLRALDLMLKIVNRYKTQ
jgi:hypothetical protein